MDLIRGLINVQNIKYYLSHSIPADIEDKAGLISSVYYDVVHRWSSVII